MVTAGEYSSSENQSYWRRAVKQSLSVGCHCTAINWVSQFL